jgi:hypothetical protein
VRLPVDEAGALRAEHDELAARLAHRLSVDEARKAIYTGFFAAIAAGVSAKLAFDRWFSTRVTAFKGPPMFFYCAAAVAAVLLALAAGWGIRARRHMRDEDALFARFQQLRARLGLDR